MQQYLNLIDTVLKNGTFKEDRTGTGTLSVFGHQMRFDLTKGFPLVTTKKVHLKSIIHELLWFLSGDTNIKYLKHNGVKIWDEWADENGDLGPVYGSQWRSWPGKVTCVDHDGGTSVLNNKEDVIISKSTIEHNYDPASVSQESIDQISNLINDLKTNPDSRRLIVSAWNVAEIPNMKLPPCHAFFQFYTTELSLEERDVLSEFPHAHRGYRLYSAALQKDKFATEEMHKLFDEQNIPRRRLSCQLYQR